MLPSRREGLGLAHLRSGLAQGCGQALRPQGFPGGPRGGPYAGASPCSSGGLTWLDLTSGMGFHVSAVSCLEVVGSFMRRGNMLGKSLACPLAVCLSVAKGMKGEGKGDFMKGDFMKGDFSKGDFMKGDFSKGDFMKGDFSKGDFSKGDFMKGDFSKGDFMKGEKGKGWTPQVRVEH